MNVRSRAVAAAAAAILATLSLAAPATAVGPGAVRIELDIRGYTPPAFAGTTANIRLACAPGFDAPIDLHVTTSPTSGAAETAPLPDGTACSILEVDLGWAGELGMFGEPVISPAVVVVDEAVETITIDVERIYDGSPPEWDAVVEDELDLLTVETAFVNRYGGLTLAGRLWCPDLIGSPIDPYFGVSWTATQYVGRKGAITAAYEPAIAHACYGASGDPMPWSTKGPGTQDTTMWIYAPNGRFGTGMIHVEVRVGGDQQDVIIQGWAPDGGWDTGSGCPATSDGSDLYDRNGDGFCAYAVTVWGAEQDDLRVRR